MDGWIISIIIITMDGWMDGWRDDAFRIWANYSPLLSNDRIFSLLSFFLSYAPIILTAFFAAACERLILEKCKLIWFDSELNSQGKLVSFLLQLRLEGVALLNQSCLHACRVIRLLSWAWPFLGWWFSVISRTFCTCNCQEVYSVLQ